MSRVLFILKKRHHYGHKHAYDLTLSSGLYNSCRFVSRLLQNEGIQSKVMIVDDNNDIDREVYQYAPTHVIVEALWVVPDKFDILKKLHPKVKWIVRLHSNSPFIALEGIAFQWISGYLAKGVSIAANHEKMYHELIGSFPDHLDQFIFLPNYYPLDRGVHFFSTKTKNVKARSKAPINRRPLHIGCFGAIRPLKNQFVQALAAIKYANENQWHLHFHINVGRIEEGSEVLKNLRSLFANTHHVLVEHDWLPHHKFLEVLDEMDVSMQVSFSETFNIVTADAVGLGVPVVVSDEVDWIPSLFVADPNSSTDIANKIGTALACSLGPWLNYQSLAAYNRRSAKVWKKYFL